MAPSLSFLPTTEGELWKWMLPTMVAHMAIGFGLRRFFKCEQRPITTVVADAALFATSLALLLTIYFPTLLPAIGSLQPYLVFGGFCGLLAGLKALLPDSRNGRTRKR